MNVFLLIILLIALVSICISLFAMAFEAAFISIAVIAITFLTWRIRRSVNQGEN